MISIAGRFLARLFRNRKNPCELRISCASVFCDATRRDATHIQLRARGSAAAGCKNGVGMAKRRRKIFFQQHPESRFERPDSISKRADRDRPIRFRAPSRPDPRSASDRIRPSQRIVARRKKLRARPRVDLDGARSDRHPSGGTGRRWREFDTDRRAAPTPAARPPATCARAETG